jgi:hypothetical protein
MCFRRGRAALSPCCASFVEAPCRDGEKRQPEGATRRHRPAWGRRPLADRARPRGAERAARLRAAEDVAECPGGPPFPWGTRATSIGAREPIALRANRVRNPGGWQPASRRASRCSDEAIRRNGKLGASGAVATARAIVGGVPDGSDALGKLHLRKAACLRWASVRRIPPGSCRRGGARPRRARRDESTAASGSHTAGAWSWSPATDARRHRKSRNAHARHSAVRP